MSPAATSLTCAPRPRPRPQPSRPRLYLHRDPGLSFSSLRPDRFIDCAYRSAYNIRSPDGYRVLHDSTPRYLQGPLTRVVDVPGRRTLRLAATNHLIMPSVKLSTVGSRAFPAAASSIWNSLPEYIYSTAISTSSENFPVPTFISGHSSVVNIF